MNHLTAEQTRRLETLLIDREKQLSAEISAAREALRQRETTRSQGLIDRTEGVDEDAAAEVAEAETERDIAELKAVQAARLRLGADLYGRCVDCEEPIEFARLLAQPAATRCAICQKGHEKRLMHKR
jgi:DnaK suppressor protein